MFPFLLFIRYYTKFLIFRRSIRNYSRPEIGSRPIGRELLLYAEVLRFVYISYVHPLRGLFLKKKKNRRGPVGFKRLVLTKSICRHGELFILDIVETKHDRFFPETIQFLCIVRSLYMRSISIVP